MEYDYVRDGGGDPPGGGAKGSIRLAPVGADSFPFGVVLLLDLELQPVSNAKQRSNGTTDRNRIIEPP